MNQISPSLPVYISLRPGHPDFLDLPWDLPLEAWRGVCPRLEDVPRGLSRHPVAFVNYAGALYAIKEMPPGAAEIEYNLLSEIETLRLPAVTPVGHAVHETASGKMSVLITRHLDRSLPFRMLFMRGGLERYRPHLLDAMAILLVQLHLSGVFWGDCSLSNTLFRKDAGALQAYLVDAETAEIGFEPLPPRLRYHDLEIMEENIDGEISDLIAENLLGDGLPRVGIGASIRIRYQNLWQEINQQMIIHPDERYRIQERIRALNSLGFSIGEVNISQTEQGDQLQLRVVVTDRNFHRDQLFGLTGIEAEEGQARQMMNEILEVQATLSHQNNRNTPLSAAAYYWLENIFQPILEKLAPIINKETDPAELYCQVLEHKWYLSEKARHDVGHQSAVEDFLKTFGQETGDNSYQSG